MPDKARKTDRVLVLKVKDGEKALSSTGLVDPRLFTGENRLHAIQDEQNRLWKFKYDAGAVPPALSQRYLTFDDMLQKAKVYFSKRNVEIVEVID